MTTLTLEAARKPFLPVPNRVFFTIPEGVPLIGGLDIMWYGILVTLGIVLGVMVLCKKAPSRGLDPDKMLDMILWSIPFGVVGARLYYVIFEWKNYAGNFSEIFNIRGGGLAIHGGIIGGVGVAIIFLLRNKIDVLNVTDLIFQGFAIGQAVGRWGNYFNSEAHGVATNLPWAIYCDGEFVHPTFLYESVWCLLLFVFLLWFDKHKAKYKGECTCLYFMLYSLERFFVEGLRTDSLWIGGLRQAQVISLCMMIAGAAGLIIIYKNKNKLVISQKIAMAPSVEKSEDTKTEAQK